MTDLSDAHRLVFEFLELYASFEWALKTTGCLKSQKPKARAEPDWDEFTRSLNGRLLACREADDARAFLILKPPKEQRIDENGRLGWEPVKAKSSEERYLLRLVQTVRNNLFHGGKYAAPVGPIGEPARDRPLLEASIAILRACIDVSPELERSLDERS